LIDREHAQIGAQEIGEEETSKVDHPLLDECEK